MLTINNTIDGAIQDIEIKGNTVQDPDNLADIKSVGVLQEDGTYKMSILSCGKNFNSGLELGGLNTTTGDISFDNTKFRSKNYIKIKPNMDINIKMYTQDLVVNSIFEYDANLKFIKNISPGTALSSNCAYIKVQGRHTTNGTDITSILNNNVDLQIEEGTVSTPYEPYQENKCDILLPCQLEKVGDVSDRLYYDDVEKDWCIEKNIGNVVLNGSERTGAFNTNATLTNYIQIIHPGMKLVNNTPIILSTFKNENYSSSKDYEYGYSWVVNGESCIYLNFLKSKGNTDSEFKTWLSQNPTLVKYQLATPQKIILPLSTQIQLNSFFGTTHIYMESGEVEGTIKCKIPKSLGATVQSLNNKTDILSDRIEAIEGLKDSQNMKYETDKGYLVCKETKNGVIDDLKLEGKTLVNLWDINRIEKSGQTTITSNRIYINTTTNVYSNFFYKNKEVFKPSTEYTFIIDVYKNTLPTNNAIFITSYSGNDALGRDIFSSGNHLTINGGVVGRIIRKQTSISDFDLAAYSLRSFVGNYGGPEGCEVELTITVLEGDHTQTPPSYFEGLMSVGQDVDKIEVLSRKEDGNLFDFNSQGNHYETTPFIEGNTIRIEGKWYANFELLVKPNTNYTISYTNFSGNRNLVAIYKPNENTVTNVTTNGKGTFNSGNNTKVNVYIYSGIGTLSTSYYTNFKIEEGSQVTEYVNCKVNKKQILFYNENGELEPIQELHEWDSMEKHSDNKWYYHKRSGKVVLNGSEDGIILLGDNTTSTLGFSINKSNFPNIKKISVYPDENKVFNDRFNYLGGTLWNVDSVGIALNADDDTRMFQIKLLKTSLNTQDVEGFKQWLQANNITVVYQLAEEEVYELAPLHLDSYANETLILCNSGAISPKMEFSITSHINELVKAYGERINLLEEKVYKYMVTQNRMQLASTYSADSVTFKVDYFSLCGDEENYDEDLYNLILNNILVGKDNYDYDKMFTIILDYASWNQISWEQFDILVGLMDMQHNPPVEELPTEDIIEEDITENEETPVE